MAQEASSAATSTSSGPTAGTTSRVELVLQPSTAPHETHLVDVLPSLGWPVATVLIVLLLRRALAAGVAGLTARAQKISLGVFAIEMGQVTARSSSTEALDELRDTARDATTGDSSAGLKSSLANELPSDYALVNLGSGREWLTSRLYVLASLATRMRRIRLIVFVGIKDGRSQFLGAAESDKLRWALVSRYPWLELAFAQALGGVMAPWPPATTDAVNVPFGADGRLTEAVISQLVSSYKLFLQMRPPFAPPAGVSGWTEIGGSVWERGAWVTEELLGEITGSGLMRGVPVRSLTTTDEELTKSILRAESDLVPIVDDQRALRQVVKRREFVNRIARRIADEH